MSIALMTAAWQLELPTTEKMVLLALADAANDAGVTWIAVASRKAGKMDLMHKCSLSERALQGAIKRLVDGGHVTREERSGKGVIYTVHPRSKCAPAANAPPQQTTQTPAAGAGKPSVTVNALSKSRARGQRIPASWHPTHVEGLDADTELIAREAAKFRDYWLAQPGAKGVKLDWDATWRNWMRRATERKPGYGQRGQHQPSATDIAMARLAQLTADEQGGMGDSGAQRLFLLAQHT